MAVGRPARAAMVRARPRAIVRWPMLMADIVRWPMGGGEKKQDRRTDGRQVRGRRVVRGHMRVVGGGPRWAGGAGGRCMGGRKKGPAASRSTRGSTRRVEGVSGGGGGGGGGQSWVGEEEVRCYMGGEGGQIYAQAQSPRLMCTLTARLPCVWLLPGGGGGGGGSGGGGEVAAEEVVRRLAGKEEDNGCDGDECGL